MDLLLAITLVSGIATVVTVFVAYVPPRKQAQAMLSFWRGLAFRLRKGRVATASLISGRATTYVLGCFPYEPLIRRNPPGTRQQFEGPWIMLMDLVAADLGITFEHRPISATEFKNAEEISADFVVGLFHTPKRATSFDFSAPFHRIRLQGLCRRGRPKITKEELCSGTLRVGVQEGEVGWEYVDDQLAFLRERDLVSEWGTHATFEILDHLLGKRIDVAICDEISCLHFLESEAHNRKFQLAFDWPMKSYAACIAVKRGLQWDMDRLNEVMKAARNTTEFRACEDEWIIGRYAAAIEKCYLRTRDDR